MPLAVHVARSRPKSSGANSDSCSFRLYSERGLVAAWATMVGMEAMSYLGMCSESGRVLLYRLLFVVLACGYSSTQTSWGDGGDDPANWHLV